MSFNSWPFIAVFLPVTWMVFRLLQENAARNVSLAWLVAASLFFYGWFRPEYLVILVASLCFNYPLGVRLAQRQQRSLLVFGIAVNLGVLFYFKYAGLFVRTLDMAGGNFSIPDILLPLGISFFTFQKIAWLVDSYRRKTEVPDFLHYALFITFFPQLIAGPITHHAEMIPQFDQERETGDARRLFTMGLTVFILGLFKKVFIADNMGLVADPIFASAAAGSPLNIYTAWLGPLAYALQIYFDFSGYSDMAIGLGGMFGFRLPLNFFSPYKATDIIEFWRRWHITLSRFLREYLYIPLGGNERRYSSLFVTMLLGGLWHGANGTFVFWGLLHGAYIAIAHAWKNISTWRLPKPLGVALTFASVVVAWVFFRANSFTTAQHLLAAMTGGGAGALPKLKALWVILGGASLTVFFAPSAHELMEGNLALDSTGIAADAKKQITWQPTAGWAVAVAALAAISLLLLTRVNAFIYFQF